jgi:hypothetical protein
MGVITRHDLLPAALEDTIMGQQAPLGAGEVSKVLLKSVVPTSGCAKDTILWSDYM